MTDKDKILKLCRQDGCPCPAPITGRSKGNSQCEQNGVCQRMKPIPLSLLFNQGEGGKEKMNTITQQQARLICEAHEVYALLDNEEEIELLENNNPELLEAYYALHRIAAGQPIEDGNDECEEQP